MNLIIKPSKIKQPSVIPALELPWEFHFCI